jgi:ABC-2 type transport system ATP-binding protein
MTTTVNAVGHLRRVSKSFGEFRAVDDVTVTLHEGVIHGLLGRNGAGKTTLMRILTGQEFASSGEVELLGGSPVENDDVLARTSFVREGQKYPDDYTVRGALHAASRVHPFWDRELADRLLADFELPAGRKVKKLSRGMMSWLGIVIGMASRAPVTIFDEPYLGLDAVAREMFYDHLLAAYAEYPRTIVLSTHLIDEVSRLIERVVVVDEGRILLDEATDDLRGRASMLTGASSAVDEFLDGAPVLGREVLGDTARVVADLRFDEDVRGRAAGAGLSVEPVSLQQLVVAETKMGYGHE